MHGPLRRVLVAGHLHLDAPLRQFPALPDDFHDLLRDATTIAFETLVEAAVDQAVDALIVSGHVFAGTPTLRGAATFRDGVETLLEAGIEVLWSFPPAGQLQMLRQVRCLPRGLKLLSDDHPEQELCPPTNNHEPAVRCVWIERPLHGPDFRDQRDVAGRVAIGFTQRSIGHLSNGMMLHGEDDKAYPIVLSGQPQRSHTSRSHETIYHAPGSLQFLEDGLYGPATATLLQIDSAGDIDLLTLETGPVRREQRELNLEQLTTFDEVLEQAELELLELTPELDEHRTRLLELHWQIRCSCERLEEFDSAQLVQQLSRRLAETEQSVPLRHRVQVIPLFTGQPVVAQEYREEYLEQQFLQQLSFHLSQQTEADQLRSALEQLQASRVATCSLPWKQLLEQINGRGLSHRAAELGLQALQGTVKAG